jgi:hypothetical protein
LKTRLRGGEFEEMEEHVEERFDRVTPQTMQRIDENWIEKLPQLINTDVDYI